MRRFVVLFVLMVAIVPVLVFAQCDTPSVPLIVGLPDGAVASGQTYALNWTATAGKEGVYKVERSTSPAFGESATEIHYMSARASSFIAFEVGAYYHRVSAVAGCDASLVSEPTSTAIVTVVAGAPVVVITRPPEPAFVDIGGSADSVTRTIVIESLSDSQVTVEIVRDEGTFFTVVDPAGGDTSALVLDPGKPKELQIRFNGVSTDARRAYEGLISIRGVGEVLKATPYAVVSLLVAGSSADAQPYFAQAGTSVTAVAFEPYPPTEPDESRQPLAIEVHNPGETELELGLTVEPDVWVLPRDGWNSASIPAGASIQVELVADRSKVSPQAAFPRFTFLKAVTKSGRVARLRVEDRSVTAPEFVTFGPDPSGQRSFLVNPVAKVSGAGSVAYVTSLRISNVSNQPVEAILNYKPSTESTVASAVVVVPANDVVSYEDLLAQVFNVSGGQLGAVRILSTASSIEALTVSSRIIQVRGDVVSSTFSVPVFLRGEGARLGRPQIVAGLVSDDPATQSGARSILDIVETSLEETTTPTTVLLTFSDAEGQVLYSQSHVLGAGEARRFALGGSVPAGTKDGTVRVDVQSGNGTIGSVLKQIDNGSGFERTTFVGKPVESTILSKRPMANLAVRTHAIVGVENGKSGSTALNLRTFLFLTAVDEDALVNVSLISSRALASPIVTINVPAGKTLELPDALGDLFGITGDSFVTGTILFETLGDIVVNGSVATSEGIVLGSLPTVTIVSEALVSASGLRRPVYLDGLEQSTDPTRGQRWSLHLTEIVGSPSAVSVRLYEAANRTAPIATKNYALAPRQHLELESIFEELGLETEQRRKDRYNVQVVVFPVSGKGRVVANAIGTEVGSGYATRYVLTPNGGVPASDVSLVAPVLPPPEPVDRRRPVRR